MRSARGFTLVELAVVLLVLSVVAAVLFPRLPKPGQARTREALRRLAGSVQALYEEATFKKKALR